MSERPNLLYLHSDQHSPFVAGCYGDELVHTPNLDRLAARGVVLDACYCPSPLCVPSRMSALTGRHPFENGVWTNSHVLDSAIPTLAHSMGADGYRPALIGRMHALGPDQLHGYAERLVGDHGPNHLGGRGVDHGELTGTAGPARVSLVKSGPGQSAYQVHDEDVTECAVEWLGRQGERRRDGDDSPFSLSVGFMLPHQPFVAKGRGLLPVRGPHDPAPDPGAVLRRPAPAPAGLAPGLRHRGGDRGGGPAGAHRLLGPGDAARPHDRPHPRRPGDRRPGGEHPRPLHLRPRRAGRRARTLVEADLLRGLGAGAGGPVVAGTAARGRAAAAA